MNTRKPTGTAKTSTTYSSGVESVGNNVMNMTLNMEPTKILPPAATVEESVLKNKSLTEMGFDSINVEGWAEIVQPPQNNLCELMRHMIKNHLKPNVQIRIGSMTFNCHMMVLQCYSDFFMECGQEVLIHLPEEKIPPTAFMNAYNWMLADTPRIQRENVVELLVAANFLSIQTLLGQCWSRLDNDVHFCEDTAIMLYLEAKMYNQSTLVEVMFTRVSKFFLTLVSSRDFLDLQTGELCSLLNLNTIGVNSEVEVFMSVVRWLDHDWSTRQTDMLTVVRCVRFNLMPAYFLVTLTKPTDSMEINRIIANPEVRNMIHEGMYCTATNMAFGSNRAAFFDFLARNALAPPIPRIWVYDKGCSYHHQLHCGTVQEVSYKMFLQYLHVIRSNGKNYWQKLQLAKRNVKCLHCLQ